MLLLMYSYRWLWAVITNQRKDLETLIHITYSMYHKFCGLFSSLFRSIITVRCDGQRGEVGMKKLFLLKLSFLSVSCLNFKTLKAIETRIFPSAWAVIMKQSWFYSYKPKEEKNFHSEFSPAVLPTFTFPRSFHFAADKSFACETRFCYLQ